MAVDVEKLISPLVQNQFPEFYKNEGELFITFVKAYYEWLEAQTFTDADGNTVENPAAALYHSRRLPEYRDIDKTIEDFIVDFKNKYLPNVQFNTATNKRLFIKNALDFYRAKGTERAVDLFFKLVYGLEAQVYYPGDDLFRLSDNSWQNVRYIEIIPNPNNVNFVGEPIFGVESNARAFCDKLVKVKKGSKLIDVLYLSGLVGTFQAGEDVQCFPDPESEGNKIDVKNTIIGSLSRFEIITSDSDFGIGERVYVADGLGKRATALVSSTESAVGIVDFEIIDNYKGWGYSADAAVLGTDRIIQADQLVFENTDYFYHKDPFQQFDLAKQDLITLRIETANTSLDDIDLLDELTIHTNDDYNQNVVFTCTVVEKNVIDDLLICNYIKENYTLSSNNIPMTDDNREIWGQEITTLFANNSGNTVTVVLESSNSSLDSIVDSSVQANVIAVGNTLTIEYSSNNDVILQIGDVLTQREPVAQQRFAYVTINDLFEIPDENRYFINGTRTSGYFRSNMDFYRESDNAEFTVEGISNVQIGLIQYDAQINRGTPFKRLANTYSANTSLNSYVPGSANNRSFTYSNRAIFRGPDIALTNQVDFFYYDAIDSDGNSLKLSSLDLDTIIANTEYIDSDDQANSDFYYLSSDANNAIEFSNTTLEDALNYTNTAVTVGGLESIVTTDPGEGYGADPMFLVYDERAHHLERYDFYIKFLSEGEANDLQKAFQVGEEIKVGSTFARGIITSFNVTTREMTVTRTYLSNEMDDANTAIEENNLWTESDFRIGDTIVGQTSGIAAVIENVNEMRMMPRTGLNARISSTAKSGSGFVTGLSILDSGFGYSGKKYDSTFDSYVPGEPLKLKSFDDENKEINVEGFVEKNGVAPGLHPSRRSFLSSDKYLQDNDFYQEYSYQVLTALPFSQYKSTLIEVLHLAGSKPFGGYKGTAENEINIISTSSESTFDIKQFGLFINENTFALGGNTVIQST